MRVLVTGATGFIGSHLMEQLRWHPNVKALLGVGRSVTAKQMTEERDLFRCDLSKERLVKHMLGEFEPDVIFHLAANPRTDRGGYDTYETNILPTHYLLANCKAGTRFVYASSATVYGDLAKERGVACYETDVTQPTSIYGMSKLASESLVNVYTSQGKVKGVSLRLVATVGEGATHGLIPDVIRKLCENGDTIRLIGPAPGTIKPFLHVSDVVSAFLKTIEPDRVHLTGVYNVNNPWGPVSVANIASVIAGDLGVLKQIEWVGEPWVGDNTYVNIASGRFESHFGWVPKYIDSITAIKEVVSQCKESLAAAQ